MGDIPRAGTGQEIYLIPTITAAPSSATQEYGLEPGFPTPADANRTTHRLGIVGSVKEASKALLPITVTVEGTAALKAGLQQQIETALTGNGVKITDLVRQVKRIINPPVGGVPVPRFGITRNGQPLMGIDPDFTGASFPAITMPSGYTLPLSTANAPSAPMVIDDRGRLICSFLVERSSGGDAGKHRILTYYFDQSTHASWQSAVSVTEWDTNWVLNNGALLNKPHLAMVNYRGDIYAFISTAGSLTAPVATGSILVYRLNTSGAVDPPWEWEAIGSPVLVSSAQGVFVDGGISAAAMPDRVVVAVGAFGMQYYGFREDTRSIWIGQSSDLEQWAEASDNSGGFVALGGFRPALPVESDGARLSQRITRVRMHIAQDNQRGWAVTDGGRIYATQDGGSTWVMQDSPVTVPLYDVVPVAGIGDSIVVYACGASGCVLKTDDSGTTWKIVSISAGEASKLDADDFLVSDEKSRPPLGDGPLYAMTWYDADNGWVVGSNKIAFTSEGGTSWKKVEPKETQATYTSVIWVSATKTGNAVTDATIVVGGSIQRQRTKSTTLARDTKRYRFVRITSAVNADNYLTGKYAFHSELTTDSYRIESIFKRSPSQGYACGRGGVLLYSSTLDQTTPTWTAISQAPAGRDFSSVYWREGKNAGSPDESRNELLLATADGLLCRSVDNGNNWVMQHVDTEAVGTSVAVITSDTTDDDESVILYGGGTGLWRTDLSDVQEACPALLPLSNGELLLASANLQAGQVDIRRSKDRGMTFGVIDLSDSQRVNFTAQTSFSAIDNTSLRPCLTVADDGAILLTAGSGGVVSVDGVGNTWLARDSRQLGLALGQYTISNAASQNRSRTTIAFGGGRLFSTTINASGGIDTRTGREWSSTSLVFCPVNPAVPQWIGVDDVRVVWPSLNIPKGESWSIEAAYRYPARHLVVETRGMWWRNATHSIFSQDSTFLWDSQDSDLTVWNFTAGALIGTNFRRASLAISKPDHASGTWPASAADYTLFDLDATIEEGILRLAPDNSSTGTPYNILSVAGKRWVPGQFKAGARTYYAELDNGVPALSYEIVDNGPDFLIVKRQSADYAFQAGHIVRIYGDRLWCDGSGGRRNAIPVDPLIDTPYEFGRLLRLVVPAQPVPDNYAKIEGVVLGRHVPITVQTSEGEFQRDRFDRDWRMRFMQSAIQERSLTGAVATETFGRPKRTWSLQYTAAQWFDITATLAPMLGVLKRPFALVMDHADPQSVEWCNLTDDPEVQQVGGDLQSVQLAFEEVV